MFFRTISSKPLLLLSWWQLHQWCCCCCLLPLTAIDHHITLIQDIWLSLPLPLGCGKQAFAPAAATSSLSVGLHFAFQLRPQSPAAAAASVNSVTPFSWPSPCLLLLPPPSDCYRTPHRPYQAHTGPSQSCGPGLTPGAGAGDQGSSQGPCSTAPALA